MLVEAFRQLTFLRWIDIIIVAKAEEYVVHIYTANERNAGTDARVYVKFHGENGVLSQTEIDPPGDSFERNA